MGTDTDIDTGPMGGAAGPRTRQYLYGLGFIGIVLAVVVGAPIWLFVAGNTCGCVTPADIVLYNADTRPVTITWVQPGVLGMPLLGRAETQGVAACTTSGMVLGVGRDRVTVTSSTASTALDVDVPSGHGAYEIPIFLVHAGGAIERLPAPLPDDRVPGEGRCGG